MWRRKSVGPILAAVGLGMVAVASLGVELTAFLASVYIAPGPLTYLIDVCTVLSLLFVLLPGTSRYLKTHRPALWSRSAPNTARDEDHLRSAQAWAATGCPAFDQR